MKKIMLLALPLLIFSCTGTKSFRGAKNSYKKSWADSLLARGLDHEALFTLIDTIKPMSSLKSLAYPIAKDSTHSDLDYRIAKDARILDTIALYQQICDRLSNGKIKLVMVPFQQVYKGKRNLELYAVNLQKFKSKITEQSAFFGQFGITPQTDPAQAVTILEYESRYDRWRGYGYLFGYPDYAVNFFVEAGRQQDSTGQMVKRDFFHIPVYAAPQGHFTYAMPKGHQPGAIDSLLYNNAAIVLERYRKLRARYSTGKGIKAIKLWEKALRK